MDDLSKPIYTMTLTKAALNLLRIYSPVALWLQTSEGKSGLNYSTKVPVFSVDGEPKLTSFPTRHRVKCLKLSGVKGSQR